MNAQTPTGLVHPEVVAGRRLWMEGSVRDVIAKVRFGDPLRGWEGDERIELYWDPLDERFELWRLEDDGEYRRICRSGEGVGFDERVIDALVSWDGRRRRIGLAEQIERHNEAVEEQRVAEQAEWVAEELAPRLRHAVIKEM